MEESSEGGEESSVEGVEESVKFFDWDQFQIFREILIQHIETDLIHLEHRSKE